MLRRDSKESRVTQDAVAKEKAENDLKLLLESKSFINKSKGIDQSKEKAAELFEFLVNHFDNIKGSLIHTDAEEIDHCYLVEIVKEMSNNISKENEKYREEISAKREISKNEKALSENEALLEKLVQIDNALAVSLKILRDQEEAKDKDRLRASFSKATREDIISRRSTSAMHDREYFNGTYNALEAKVWLERDKRKEKFNRILNSLVKWGQKDGVRTAIQIGGVVAIGVTSGGIGLGAVLLTKVGAQALNKGHEAFLEKYYKVPPEYKEHLETFEANAKLLKANIDSLVRLKLKRDAATGEAKKLLDLQIRVVEVSILSSEENKKLLAELELETETVAKEEEKIKQMLDSKTKTAEAAVEIKKIEAKKKVLASQIKAVEAAISIKTMEEKLDKEAFEVLVDLISSRDPEKRADATKFLDGFAQETRKLQAEGEKAFLDFRENTQNLLDEAQKKSNAATLALNAAKSKASINEKEYNDLMFNAIEAQGAVNDILKRLDESYHQLLEVQRRDELYGKLAEELKKRSSDLESNLEYAELKSKIKLGDKAQQVQQAVKDNKLSIEDQAVAAAATLFSANDTTQGVANAAMYVLEQIKNSNVNAVVHNVEFQRRAIDVLATVSKEAVSKLSTPLQANAEQVYNYLSEHLSSMLLEGVPAAHLVHGLSPAGACAMLGLLIYTTAHDRFYSAKLKKNFLEITTLLDGRDISTLEAEELKKLQELVGQTIHEFGNLLPKSMGDHLKRSKEIYEAELERTKLFARATTRFSDVVMHKEPLGIVTMYGPNFDKKKVYIASDPKDSNILIAYYYDGKKWDFKPKTKEEFDKQNFKTKSKGNGEVEIEKIAQFFGCKRTTLSEKKTKALKENEEKLNKLYGSVQKENNEQKTDQQVVYCLTGLYRGIVNQAAIKNGMEARDGSFELSRKRELMIILDKSEITSQEEREKAVPLIQAYVKNRQEIIDTLEQINGLSKPDADNLKKLNDYKYAHVDSGKPYAFLEGKNLDALKEMGEKLRAEKEEMSKKLTELVIEDYISNRKAIIETLEQIKQLDKTDVNGLATKLESYKADSEKPREFSEGKNLDALKEMGENLRADNEKMSAKLSELKKQAELEKQAEAAKNAPKLSVENNTPTTPKPSRTQEFFAKMQRAFASFSFRGIFKSKPPTAPETASEEEELHPSLKKRLLGLKDKRNKHEKETASKALILSPKSEASSFPTDVQPDVQLDKVAKTVKTQKSGPH